MKFAIISDIHSNLEALEKVLDYCKTEKIDKFICVGDIVGYNADPSKCLEIVKSLDIKKIVRGNHDEYAGIESELAGFNPYAKDAILWTRKQLDSTQRDWLANNKLKEVDFKRNITVVHATLDSPSSWGYIFDNHHAIDNFSYQYTKLCFCGHSHVPVLFEKNHGKIENTVRVIPEWEEINNEASFEIKVDIDNTSRYLVNIGSIGQPRNGDPRASFVVLDDYKREIKRVTLRYDIEKAQEKIIKEGLPIFLAKRLANGF
ncbi:MAG: metallophosphatase family protein [Victivallales bacterium]|nr:metallophosphatase family protein [Victivallales bacterium]